MKFTCTVSQQANGNWNVRHAGSDVGPVTTQGGSREEALDKMRDSYNVNGLAQIAALATLDDLPYYRKNLRRIAATRKRLVGALESLGFDVLPSQANFLLVRPPGPSAKSWLGRLRKRKILVRWFDSPVVRDRLRITIGTDREINALLRAVKAILKR